jgi:antitoxin ParD1/3/4
MPENHEISVELTEDEFKTLKAAVEAGEYASASEVVREAIHDWHLKREHRQRDMERLRQLWHEGKASGPPQPFDIERPIAAAKARHKVSGK